MTFVCKWLLGLEMAFFVLFKRGGGRVRFKETLFPGGGDEKTLISCLSSDIWLFGSGFSLLIAVFTSAKKGGGI